MKTRFLLPVFLLGAIGHPGMVMAQSTATSTPGATSPCDGGLRQTPHEF